MLNGLRGKADWIEQFQRWVDRHLTYCRGEEFHTVLPTAWNILQPPRHHLVMNLQKFTQEIGKEPFPNLVPLLPTTIPNCIVANFMCFFSCLPLQIPTYLPTHTHTHTHTPTYTSHTKNLKLLKANTISNSIFNSK